MSTSTNSAVKYLHLRRPHVKMTRAGMEYDSAGLYGGITCAYQHVGETVRVAFARCRSNEVYKKRLGREQALSRLVGNEVFVLQDGAKPIDAIVRFVAAAPVLKRALTLSMKAVGGAR